MVINQLNAPTAAESAARQLDVSGDGDVSPFDALLIINQLNAPAADDGTAGASSAASAVTFADSPAETLTASGLSAVDIVTSDGLAELAESSDGTSDPEEGVEDVEELPGTPIVDEYFLLLGDEADEDRPSVDNPPAAGELDELLLELLAESLAA